MGRPGRPRKPSSVKLRHRYQVSFTDEAMQKLEDEAKKQRIPATDIIRKWILERLGLEDNI
jgi:5-methylcytosine-specific restriction endonuclease McrBC GTP-binding regulatory subunit McrB